MTDLITIGDVELNVRDEGPGEPLLLVHGFPLDHTMWREQIRHFSGSRRVIAPDLRGFGRSGVTPGTVTMQRFADDLAKLLDVLRIREPVCFCGLSMGGYIAWQFAQRHRRRLGSLILCDTRAIADDEAGKRNRAIIASRVLKDGPGFIADSMPEKLFSTRTHAENPELIAETQDVIRRSPPQGVAAAARGLAARPDVSAQLGAIDVPTLVVVGEEDAISPADEMQRIAESIPGAHFAAIPSAGHMAPLEAPVAVNTAIKDFLNG